MNPDAANPPDARAGDDSSDAPSARGVHLLVTEVKTNPTDEEFVEIYNPSSSPVDLSRYFLSDSGDYPLTAGRMGAGPMPVVASDDFIVQFPPGATIAPGQVIVVATDEAGYGPVFGAPDYSINNSVSGTAMLEIVEGASINLETGGDMIALFFWDGASDLVADVDLVNIGGAPGVDEQIPDKTAIAVDGPDADTTMTGYAPDAKTMGVFVNGASNGRTHKRIALEGDNESHDIAGNGIDGDDETSENIALTWDDAPNRTLATPGVVPVELEP